MTPPTVDNSPGDYRRSRNAALMLGRRLRHWPNIKAALRECLLFAGTACDLILQSSSP